MLIDAVIVKIKRSIIQWWLKFGANEPIRTADLLITNEPLYHLSYIGLNK